MNIRTIAVLLIGLACLGMVAFKESFDTSVCHLPATHVPIMHITQAPLFYEPGPVPVLTIDFPENWSGREVPLPQFDDIGANFLRMVSTRAGNRPHFAVSADGTITPTSGVDYPDSLQDDDPVRLISASLAEARSPEAPLVEILDTAHNVIVSDGYRRVNGSPSPGLVAELPLFSGPEQALCSAAAVVGYLRVSGACTAQNLRIASAGILEWEAIASERALPEPELLTLAP